MEGGKQLQSLFNCIKLTTFLYANACSKDVTLSFFHRLCKAWFEKLGILPSKYMLGLIFVT